MNKRKLLTLAMALCVVAILAIGGTLAYFTDTDAQQNVFTTGNVEIDLWEDFGDNLGTEKLLPAVGSAQAGTLKNGVEKEVYVENTGSEDAYVRVHIAIPARLDDGDPSFNAGKNTLHFNYNKDSVATGKWNWTKSATTGPEGSGTNWNFYKTTVDGVEYNVYVVTYMTALKQGNTTCDAIHQVYLDKGVTNEEIEAIKTAIGYPWKILVAAEGAQADGFENAYDALNASFGVPGTYAVDFASYHGKTFINND